MPVSYDKWIREQIVELLKLPKVYNKTSSLFEIQNFERFETVFQAEELHRMLQTYVKIEYLLKDDLTRLMKDA